jgi:integrase
LRAIFEQARRWGYVTGQTIPIIKTERLKSKRRPNFDIKEYRRLTRISVRRWKKAPSELVRLERMLLHDWLLIMSNSGMRPTEAKNLRWKDVEFIEMEDGGHIVRLWVEGKGKRRDLIAQHHVRCLDIFGSTYLTAEDDPVQGTVLVGDGRDDVIRCTFACG